MYARQLLLGALAAASIASASAIDGEELFSVLLKRQEPGTPAYNCHDNCGRSIASQGTDCSPQSEKKKILT